MSPNKSKQQHRSDKRNKADQKHEQYLQVLGELTSIDRTVSHISTIVDGLDEKMHMLTTTPRWATDVNPEQPESRSITAIALRSSLSADEHNYYARLHNSLGQDGDYVLMPLRDKTNRLVSSFPRTIGRLAFIYEDGELFEMLKCFALTPTNLRANQEFCEFVGVNFGLALHVIATYTLPRTPSVAESRTERERIRASTVHYAVAPTRDTQGNIERLNTHARAENRFSLFELQPLRDVWGLIVPSFPKDLFELFNPVYQADVRFLLKEYAQSDEPEGCERRWVEFVGAQWAARVHWLQDEMVFLRYTAV